MPWTYATFLIGSLSLAGIWPLAGFWSKDEILATAFEANSLLLFVLAMITVFMTAFYMFRAVFLTFHGEYKGGGARRDTAHDHTAIPHESPWVMVVPLVILAVLAIISGWWNVTGGFNAFLGMKLKLHGSTSSKDLFGIRSPIPLPVISLLVAVLGIFLAYAMYIKKWISARTHRRRPSNRFIPCFTASTAWTTFMRTIIVKTSPA